MNPLTVERISVRKDRISLQVRMAPKAPRMTDARLARYALAKYPTLADHSCLNDRGSCFACVIAETSVPHLLEHLIIEEQVRDPQTRDDARCVGTTEWLDELEGLARVEVNFADDLIALRAVRDAAAFLNRGLVR